MTAEFGIMNTSGRLDTDELNLTTGYVEVYDDYEIKKNEDDDDNADNSLLVLK